MRGERVAVVAAVTSVVLIAGAAALLRTGADGPAVGADAPRAVDVACSPDGITLSTDTVAAGPGGVTLRVSSTMLVGSYLAYDAPGYGMGEPLPVGEDSWVRPIPPNEVELSCTTDGKTGPGMSAHLLVADPEGYWRHRTLQDAGCVLGAGQPSWVIGSQTGATARAAVDAVLAAFANEGVGIYTASEAGLGYPEAAEQTWVARRESGPGVLAGFTIDVRQTETGFEAGPDYICD